MWLINLNGLENKNESKREKRKAFIKRSKTSMHSINDNKEVGESSLAYECGAKCRINLSHLKHFLKDFQKQNIDNNELEQNFLVEFVRWTTTLVIPIVQYLSKENETAYAKLSSVSLNCIYIAKVIDRNADDVATVVNLCDQNGGMVM